MKLKPFTHETPVEQIAQAYRDEARVTRVMEVEINSTPIDPEALDEVLISAGVKEIFKVSDLDVNSQFKKYLEKHGGGLEEVAQMVSNIMNRGESDSSRLRAAELVAKIHGIKAEIDEIPIPKDVTINIFNSSNSEAKTLISFIMPKQS